MNALRNSLRALFVSSPRQGNTYYHLVDLVRGCAALAILVWHYQHFYYQTAGRNPIVYDREVQPFYAFLKVFYDEGYFAVQLFWVISGFVFSSVYAGTQVSGKEFFVNRLARLYPLHFATLIIVATLQATSMHVEHEYQIYPYNDAYHFLLNLLFVSHWGFEAGDSFNAPIWSVSVEIFIYIAFWMLLRRLFRFGIAGPLAMAAISGILIVLKVPGRFWECGLYFFMGCAVYVWLMQAGIRYSTHTVIGLSGVILGGLVLALDVPGAGDLSRVVLFTSLVLVAAAADLGGVVRLWRPFSGLGDLTYSLYLLHVPVQIALILLMDLLDVNRSIVSSHIFFLAFMMLMLLLASGSYYYFELPARRWMRRKLGTLSGRTAQKSSRPYTACLHGATGEGSNNDR